tara:strand:- start:539 stop:1978 length:1440 start_codon:yes stop_codon:yes gene_type:complete
MKKILKSKFQPNVLVIGDLMLDHYLIAKCERISPEAPVQIAEIISEYKVLGGAGNVISNLRSLNSNVGVISIIGEDFEAIELKNILKEMNVSSEMVFKDKDRKTTKKSRILSGSQQIMRFDHESKAQINDKLKKKIFIQFSNVINDYDCIILSDYGKGILRNDLTSEIISLANKSNKKVLVDPKGDNFSKYSGCFLMTPNVKEASIATKIEIDDDKSLEKTLKKLKKDFNLEHSIITLSERGISLYNDDKLKIFKTKVKEVYDVTGAGDTVISALAVSLSKGDDINAAIRFANFAAGVVVGKVGSATATLNEIELFKKEFNDKNILSSKIINYEVLDSLIKNLKNQRKKIVFTNGCFDLLHRGHLQYLFEAKNIGDILILGLNSDNSVKILKGQDRPINNQSDRANMLSFMSFIDFIIIFDEETPYELIKKIQPDFLVKGGDYNKDQIVGKDFAKKTVIIPFLEGFSSTKLMDRIIKNK